MDLTIVVSCYNKEKEITPCLHSLLGLQGLAYEIVVLDDASTDQSVAVVQQWIQSHPQAPPIRHYISQKNRGVSRIRNIGTRLAQGLYVHWLDGDDAVTTAYQTQIGFLLKQIAPDWLTMKLQWRHSGKIRPVGGMPGLATGSQDCPLCLPIQNIHRFLEHYFPLAGSQVLVKRSWALSVRFVPRETVFEDFSYHFRLLERSPLRAYYWDQVGILWNEQPYHSLSKKKKRLDTRYPEALSCAPTPKMKGRLVSIWLLNQALTLPAEDLLPLGKLGVQHWQQARWDRYWLGFWGKLLYRLVLGRWKHPR